MQGAGRALGKGGGFGCRLPSRESALLCAVSQLYMERGGKSAVLAGSERKGKRTRASKGSRAGLSIAPARGDRRVIGGVLGLFWFYRISAVTTPSSLATLAGRTQDGLPGRAAGTTREPGVCALRTRLASTLSHLMARTTGGLEGKVCTQAAIAAHQLALSASLPSDDLRVDPRSVDFIGATCLQDVPAVLSGQYRGSSQEKGQLEVQDRTSAG